MVDSILCVKFFEFWTDYCLNILFLLLDCSSHKWISFCSFSCNGTSDEEYWSLYALSLDPKVYCRERWHSSSRPSSLVNIWCVFTCVDEFSEESSESWPVWVPEITDIYRSFLLCSTFHHQYWLLDSSIDSQEQFLWIEAFNGDACDYYLHISSFTRMHRMYDTRIHACVFTPLTPYTSLPMVILSDSRMSSMEVVVNENILAILLSQILCCSSARGLRWPLTVPQSAW